MISIDMNAPNKNKLNCEWYQFWRNDNCVRQMIMKGFENENDGL